MIPVQFLLFDDFETLDAFGPAEILGRMEQEYDLRFYSPKGGIVTSRQGIQVTTLPMQSMAENGILVIPGGMGTRMLIADMPFIQQLTQLAKSAATVLSVCTGSALLAKTGLLDGKCATSNKIAFDWVCSVREAVQWVRQARWVQDGPFYTSSGVSAGMDMTLGFIADTHGKEAALEVARTIEYIWNEDPLMDPFA